MLRRATRIAAALDTAPWRWLDWGRWPRADDEAGYLSVLQGDGITFDTTNSAMTAAIVKIGRNVCLGHATNLT
jgi:hypothetical protein